MLRSKFFWNSEDEEINPEISEIIYWLKECAKKRLSEMDLKDRSRKPKNAVKMCLKGFSGDGSIIVIDKDGVPVDPCGKILWFNDCKDSSLIWALKIATNCKRNRRAPPRAMIFMTDKWNMKMEESFSRVSLIGDTLDVTIMKVFPIFGL